MNSPHFLLATDLMDGSHEIALQSQILADKFSATLSLLHVIELPTYTHYAQSITYTDTLCMYMESAKSILMNLGNEFNIPIERQYVKDGRAADLTLSLSQSLDIDTIIIGSHQKEGPSFLSTTASNILHGAKCNVYIVKLTTEGGLIHE